MLSLLKGCFYGVQGTDGLQWWASSHEATNEDQSAKTQQWDCNASNMDVAVKKLLHTHLLSGSTEDSNNQSSFKVETYDWCQEFSVWTNVNYDHNISLFSGLWRWSKAGKSVFLLNIMMSQWSWPMTFRIEKVIFAHWSFVWECVIRIIMDSQVLAKNKRSQWPSTSTFWSVQVNFNARCDDIPVMSLSQGWEDLRS